MPEEASESLVRVYLESKDFLVTTNKKLRIRHKVKTKKGEQVHHSAYEVDIVALNPKKRIKIIGEVKGWRSGFHRYHFRKLHKPKNALERAGQRALKIINDKRHQTRLKKSIEKVYGSKGWKIVLFVDHIYEKDKDEILRLAKRQGFEIYTFRQMLKELDEVTLKFSYSNDPIMQLLRIQKRNQPK